MTKRVFSGIVALLLATSLALNGCSAKRTSVPNRLPSQKPGENISTKAPESPKQPEVYALPDYLSENEIVSGIVTIHLPTDWTVDLQGQTQAYDPEFKCMLIIVGLPLGSGSSFGISSEVFDDAFFDGVYQGLSSEAFVFPDGHERACAGSVVYEKSLVTIDADDISLKGYLIIAHNDKSFYIIECFVREPFYTDLAPMIQDILNSIEFEQNEVIA